MLYAAVEPALIMGKKWGVSSQNLALPFPPRLLACARSSENAQTLFSPQENPQRSPMGSCCGVSANLPQKVVLPAQTLCQAAPMTARAGAPSAVFSTQACLAARFTNNTALPSRPPPSKCYLLVFSAQFAIAPPINEAWRSSIDVCILHAASFHTY